MCTKCAKLQESVIYSIDNPWRTVSRMKVVVHLLPTRKETKVVELERGATVESVIRGVGLLPDGWIAVLEGEPVPIDHALEEDCELKLLSVVSGG